MPMYFFTCGECDKLYEILVPLARLDRGVECPHCSKKLKRHIGAPAFKVN